MSLHQISKTFHEKCNFLCLRNSFIPKWRETLIFLVYHVVIDRWCVREPGQGILHSLSQCCSSVLTSVSVNLVFWSGHQHPRWQPRLRWCCWQISWGTPRQYKARAASNQGWLFLTWPHHLFLSSDLKDLLQWSNSLGHSNLGMGGHVLGRTI